MEICRCIREGFAVIGKEGSTRDGDGFIARLWEDANAHFDQVAPLAARDGNGELRGIWGAMTDPARTHMPWTDGFREGLYLAGVECIPDAQPPEGWTRWDIPGYEYLCAPADSGSLFSDMLRYMQEEGLSLVGAVHDFICPATGQTYMFFPIRRL